MSIFIHRCPECGHADHEHTETKFKGRSCSHGWCPCSRVLDQVRPEPSVLIPRFKESGEVETEIIAPGTRLVENGAAGLVYSCGCESCRAAYADATGAAS